MIFFNLHTVSALDFAHLFAVTVDLFVILPTILYFGDKGISGTSVIYIELALCCAAIISYTHSRGGGSY